MREDATRFRKRAKECRARAELADYVMRQFLVEVADGLEDEADAIEAQKAMPLAVPIPGKLT